MTTTVHLFFIPFNFLFSHVIKARWRSCSRTVRKLDYFSVQLMLPPRVPFGQSRWMTHSMIERTASRPLSSMAKEMILELRDEVRQVLRIAYTLSSLTSRPQKEVIFFGWVFKGTMMEKPLPLHPFEGPQQKICNVKIRCSLVEHELFYCPTSHG